MTSRVAAPAHEVPSAIARAMTETAMVLFMEFMASSFLARGVGIPVPIPKAGPSPSSQGAKHG